MNILIHKIKIQKSQQTLKQFEISLYYSRLCLCERFSLHDAKMFIVRMNYRVNWIYFFLIQDLVQTQQDMLEDISFPAPFCSNLNWVPNWWLYDVISCFWSNVNKSEYIFCAKRVEDIVRFYEVSRLILRLERFIICYMTAPPVLLRASHFFFLYIRKPILHQARLQSLPIFCYLQKVD